MNRRIFILCLFLMLGLGSSAQSLVMVLYVDSAGVQGVPNQPVWIAVEGNNTRYISGTTNANGIFIDTVAPPGGAFTVTFFTFDCNGFYVSGNNSYGAAQLFATDTLSMNCIAPTPSLSPDFIPMMGDSTKVDFINTSVSTYLFSSATTYQWNFGDGTGSSQVNPSHIYNAAGVYTVSLTMTIRDSIFPTFILDSQSVQQQITVFDPGCTANFSFSVNDSTVNFTNNSSSGGAPPTVEDRYRWSFGDGTFSTQLNPAHTYSANGLYQVCLEIFSIDTASLTVDTVCSDVFCDNVLIDVPVPVNCRAEFVILNFDSLSQTVTFQDSSSISASGGGTEVELVWDFGDGSKDSSATVTHTYVTDTVPRTYQVCLNLLVRDSLGNLLCSDSICKLIVIEPDSSGFNCSASYIVDTVNSYSGSVFIWNNSTPTNNNPDYDNFYTWDFGDGTTSSMAYPTHVYNGPGSYNLNLTLVSRQNSSGDSCTSFFQDTLVVDSLGRLINKSGAGFTLFVLNPENISLPERAEVHIDVYPNPAREELWVEFPAGEAGNWLLQIADISGRRILEKRLMVEEGEVMRVDLSRMPEGLYLLSLTSEGHSSHHKIKIDR